jgi:cytochrome b6-f complex iron-sulfur subunit
MSSATTDPDDVVSSLSRRKMFAVGCFGLIGAAGLAACGGDDTTATAPSDAGPSASAPAGAADAGSPTTLIGLAEVPVGGAVGLEVAGKPVIVSQPTAGEAVAFSAICPHQFATVAVRGEQLRCPLHGSTFDLATGKNLTGPAAGKPLPTVAVEVVDGNVVQA